MKTWVTLCVLGLTVVSVPQARANITYTYTGQPYVKGTAWGGGFPCGTPSCALSGWFTVPSALPDSMGLTGITPSSFRFTSPIGLVAPDPAIHSQTVDISVGTDAAGQINDWLMHIDVGQDDYNHWYSSPLGDTNLASVLSARGVPGLSPILTAGPGTWSVVPEPATVLLLGVGLAAVALGAVGGSSQRAFPAVATDHR